MANFPHSQLKGIKPPAELRRRYLVFAQSSEKVCDQARHFIGPIMVQHVASIFDHDAFDVA